MIDPIENYDDIKESWFSSKIPSLEENQLNFVSVIRSEDGKEWRAYDCPCGGKDHCATRPMAQDGYSQYPSDILTCYINNRQWLVRPVNVVAVIREEEEKYLKLVAKASRIVRKIVKKRGLSEDTLLFLKDTHGIDRELVQEILDGNTGEHK